jgi:hypothetical protein
MHRNPFDAASTEVVEQNRNVQLPIHSVDSLDLPVHFTARFNRGGSGMSGEPRFEDS